MPSIHSRFIRLASICSIAIVMVACTNTQPKANTTDTAEEKNKAKFNTNNEQDAQFIVTATGMHLDEIQFAQLAQQNSATKSIKDMGKAIEESHTRSLVDLKALAGSKAIVIPTTQTDSANDTYTRLKAQSGMDFDQEYCAMVVNTHRDAIALFETESTTAIDADIRQWAKATLPELKEHLRMALACQAKLSKK